MSDYKSWETFHALAAAPYWELEYAGMFADDCELELPYAPPGMPQYINAIDRPVHFKWLARTTRNWQFTEIQPYGAPEDSDIFWLMRKGSCKASWGGQKNMDFYSRYIIKATIVDGKIHCLKELSDPLAYLKAAGRELPVFPMIIDPAAAVREQPLIDSKRNAVFSCDDSPEVCEARKQRTLDALRYHRIDPAWADAVKEAPNIDGALFFAPADMTEDCTPHRQAGHLDWLEKSEVDANFASNEFPVYATGDPNVFFDECSYNGVFHWVGSPQGGYRNVYIDRYVFDHGYLVEYSEALNPINKFNSINVSIPSFPYFFD